MTAMVANFPQAIHACDVKISLTGKFLVPRKARLKGRLFSVLLK